jgi:hypothetical protein
MATLFADPLGRAPIPFTELVTLGGEHPMPGFFYGHLVDRSAVIWTLSYLWPIGPWLDGQVAAAIGDVFGPHLEGFRPGLLRFSGTFGLAVLGLGDTPLELVMGFGSETFESGGLVDSVRLAFGVPRSL